MRFRHGRVEIVLHTLQPGEGDDDGALPLLLLHRLGGSSADWPAAAIVWPGPVHALDFAGHGASGHVVGRGYYPEYFLADADLALERVGDRAALVGAGIGGYVALLLAGARPGRIPASLLLPGRGLEGGDAQPDPARRPPSLEDFERHVAEHARDYAPGTDALVARCERDLRPVDYAASFADAAGPLLVSEQAARARPEGPSWLAEVLRQPRTEIVPDDLALALARLRELSG